MLSIHKTEQIGEKTLSKKQQDAIPHFLTNKTLTAGCKKAEINRNTYYEWLKQPAFRAELEQQRRAITDEAYDLLGKSLKKAVQKLVKGLNSKDTRLLRLTANDIIEHHLRIVGEQELTERLRAIEVKLGIGK